jgi:hypothetical protein
MKLQQILKIFITVFLITPTITVPTIPNKIKHFSALTVGTVASILALKSFYEFFFYTNAAAKTNNGGAFSGGILATAIGAPLLYYWKTTSNSV